MNNNKIRMIFMLNIIFKNTMIYLRQCVVQLAIVLQSYRDKRQVVSFFANNKIQLFTMI